MNHQVKSKITHLLFRLYYPFCYHIEKFRAVRMYRSGVKQCIKMYKEIGSPRVYLFYDTKHSVWAPMTYEDNKKYKPSLKRMRTMGKVHGAGVLNSVERMKERSFYYTPSKWGALGSDEDKALQTQKMQTWVDYYLLKLSEPMQKCRGYLQGYHSTRRQPE